MPFRSARPPQPLRREAGRAEGRAPGRTHARPRPCRGDVSGPGCRAAPAPPRPPLPTARAGPEGPPRPPPPHGQPPLRGFPPTVRRKVAGGSGGSPPLAAPRTVFAPPLRLRLPFPDLGERAAVPPHTHPRPPQGQPARPVPAG